MSEPRATADAASGHGHEVVIRVRGLVTRFGEQVVHSDLDLDVYRGEVLGIVGGSGTGKSVLLRAILGLMKPTAGTIEVLGQEVRALDSEARRLLERRWGVLFQDGALFSSLDVTQNIEAPLREHFRLSQRLMDEIAALKISLVGLDPSVVSKKRPGFATGMRKNGDLLRALAPVFER